MRGALCIFMTMFCMGSALAQYDYGFDFSKAGTAGFQFLKTGIGARELALGQTASSLTNDANAVYWNPGALSFVGQNQLYLSHNEWLAGSSANAAVVALPLGQYVVAASFLQFTIASFQETVVPQGGASPYTGRSISAGDQAIGLAVSRRFTDKLTIGLQVKYVREWLDDVDYSNVLFDIGTVYYTGFHQLRLAFALQHFGPDMKPFEVRFRMPLTFRLGAADDIVTREDHRLTVGAELIHPTDNDELLALGFEYELFKTLALRAGYRTSSDEGRLAFGAGAHAPVLDDLDLRFDYSYSKMGAVFGATHKFTFGIGF
jgi:hypothetical protein